MSVINTNTKSIVAQNALTVNNRAMSKTMEQLSTGKRINSAADDAAGLAISNKMTSQIKGLNQAVRNANDGISMLQTAEGAMVEVTNMMQRMRELAVQSANDTNTTDDRAYLDLEFQQLKAESNRITQNTQWNGMNVLDGSFVANGAAGEFRFQVGANENQVIDHTIDQLGFSSAGANATAVITNPTSVAATLTITNGTVGYKAGDVVSVKLGEDLLQYKVSQADIDANDGASPPVSTTADAIAAGILSSFQTAKSQEGRFVGIEMAAAASPDNTLEITKTDTTTFVTGNLSSSVKSGNLAALNDLSVTNRANSNNSIDKLDDAIKTVSEARAEIGSVINRLTYAADNLANVSQNTTASRSQIQDTDYAQATTELARTQIISQAATAMLAQANQAPQSVLSLLR
jgi:flagellin